MSHSKRTWQAVCTGMLCVFLGVTAFWMNCETGENDADEKNGTSWEKAETTPLTPYPETVTYTLAKMTASGNSGMPEGDTYEDNAYTRYLKKTLNVQNEDVLEVSEDENYYLYIQRMIAENNLPDVMLVSSPEDVQKLAEYGMIENLSEAYQNATSGTIKSMYSSYGKELLESVTFDGKLMALPSTQVYYGCNLFWVREDWREQLGLPEPSTLADVEQIVQAFREADPGGNGNIGLPCLAELYGKGSANFSADPIFAAFHAYPGIWLQNAAGAYEYGSLTEETRQALEYLHGWYEEGILDQDYMMRTPGEIGELIRDNRCGAFFGWWWAPNNPLMEAVEANPEAEWKPYVITDEQGKVNSYIYGKTAPYIVVRKGYEHPEAVMKIMTALFDNARYRHNGSSEIDEYQKRGADITTRPLVANCDYSNAVFTTTDRIWLALHYPRQMDSMNSLESAYYDSCRKFLDGDKNAGYWAAYASRIQAVRLIEEADVSYVNEHYVPYSYRELPQDMTDMETLAFMKIITGEEPISYFDTFTESWKKNMILENLLY